LPGSPGRFTEGGATALGAALRYSLLVAKRVKPRRRRGFTRLSGKRQVTIPVQALEQTGLGPGDELRVEVDPAGRIVLTPAATVADRRQAIERTSGSLADVYEPGGLDRLRDEWR
jgi:AbrB family looped-hinge helix DNA binding protein